MSMLAFYAGLVVGGLLGIVIFSLLSMVLDHDEEEGLPEQCPILPREIRNS